MNTKTKILTKFWLGTIIYHEYGWLSCVTVSGPRGVASSVPGQHRGVRRRSAGLRGILVAEDGHRKRVVRSEYAPSLPARIYSSDILSIPLPTVTLFSIFIKSWPTFHASAPERGHPPASLIFTLGPFALSCPSPSVFRLPLRRQFDATFYSRPLLFFKWITESGVPFSLAGRFATRTYFPVNVRCFKNTGSIKYRLERLAKTIKL